MVGHVGPSSKALEIVGHQAVCFGDSKGPRAKENDRKVKG